MKIVAVVGSGSGCGKTTAICRILEAIPGLGAVKISPRAGPSRVEWGAGAAGKDTSLYVASGAVRVARIVGPRDDVPETWGRIAGEFAGFPGVVIEGTRSLDLPGERFVVFVEGDERRRPGRNERLTRVADVIVRGVTRCGDAVAAGGCAWADAELIEAIRTFLAVHKA